MKMNIKMKNISPSYDINRSKSRHGQKFSKYKVSDYDDAYMF